MFFLSLCLYIPFRFSLLYFVFLIIAKLIFFTLLLIHSAVFLARITGDSLAIVRGNTSKNTRCFSSSNSHIETTSAPRIFTLYCNTLQHFFSLMAKSVSVAGTPHTPKTKNCYLAFFSFFIKILLTCIFMLNHNLLSAIYG